MTEDASSLEPAPEPSEPPSDPPPEPRRGRLKRTAFFLGRVVGWIAAVVVCVLASVAFHVQTPTARRDIARVISRETTAALAGELDIPDFDSLDLFGGTTRNVVIRDAQGREVIRGDRVRAGIDVSAFLHGELRLTSIEIDGGFIRLYTDPDGSPSLANAFGPPADAPPDDDEGGGLRIALEQILVRDVDVRGDIVDFRDLHIEDFDGHLVILVDPEDGLDLRVHRGTGNVTGPFPYPVRLEGAYALLDDRHTHVALRASRSREGAPDEHAFGHLVVRGLDRDGPAEFDLRVRVDPISTDTLAGADLDFVPVVGPIRGRLSLRGPPDALLIRGSLDTDAGHANLEGSLGPGPIRVAVRTGSLQLDTLIEGAPSLNVSGRAEIVLTEPEPTVVVDLDPMHLGDVEIPALHAEGRLREDGVTIDDASLPLMDGDLNVQGDIGFDGAMNLRVNARSNQVASDPLLSSLLPGVRAGAHMATRLERQLDGGTRLVGRWTFTNVRYGGASARVVAATGSVSADLASVADLEDLSSLRLNLDVEASSVAAGSFPLGEARGTLRGGPARFTSTMTLREGGRLAEADLQLDLRNGLRVDAPRLVVSSGDQRFSGSVSGLYASGLVFEVGALRLASDDGSQLVAASGRWHRGRGHDDALHAEAAGLDLTAVRLLAGDYGHYLEGIVGQVAGTADITGDLEAQPEVHVDGTFEGGRFRGLELEGSLDMAYRLGRLVGDVGVTLPNDGSLDLRLRGTVDQDRPLRDALPDASLEGDVTFRNVDLALLDLLEIEALESAPELGGSVDGEVAFTGALDIFDFEGRIEVPRLALGSGDDMIHLGVVSRIGYQSGALVARVIASDHAGDLIEGEVSVLLDLLGVLQEPALLPLVLDAAPWRMAARMSPRNLGSLEEPLRRRIPFADKLRASASLTVRGGAYRPLGDLVVGLDYVGDLQGELCGQRSAPRGEIIVELRDQRTEMRASGFVGNRRFAHATGGADTPIAEWLRDVDSFEAPETDVEVFVVRAPVEDLPYVCEHVAGPITATASLGDVFSTHPTAEISVYSAGLRPRQLEARGRRDGRRRVVERRHAPASIVDVRATMNAGESLLAEGIVSWWNGGSTHVSAELPLRWNGVWDPALDDGSEPDDGEDEPEVAGADERGETERDEDAEAGDEGETTSGFPRADRARRQLFVVADLDDMPIEAPLVYVPYVGHSFGTLQGEIRMRGPLLTPEFGGELALVDAGVEIPSVGQRLEGVQGTFLFEGDRITLQRLSVQDGDGVANVAGDLELQGLWPSRLTARLDAFGFPVRREGSVLATLTGHTAVNAQFEENGMEGTLEIEDLSIRLSNDLDQEPQSLSLHPDVVVLGEEVEQEVDTDPFEVRLAIRSLDTIQLKSDDFAASFEADLQMGYASALSVEGTVEIGVGHFDVFGKRFEVERGALTFDAEHALDPGVNLVALHNLRSRPGETVTVSASGRLSDPQIRFSSSLTSDYGEIIALLVSGDVRSETNLEAERAPTDFLAGIAAGVLTLGLREELGAVVPNVIVEGNNYGGNRIRGGWRLEEILPETLRRVIQGVYIEGFFNTSGEDAARSLGQLRDYGFLLELAFPRGVVNTNTVTPPNNFSLDVTWQP